METRYWTFLRTIIIYIIIIIIIWRAWNDLQSQRKKTGGIGNQEESKPFRSKRY